MSTYEDDHNIPHNAASDAAPRRLPDLSTFFSNLEHASSDSERTLPRAEDVSAVHRQLANALQRLQGTAEGVTADDTLVAHTGHTALTDDMITELMAGADAPPAKLAGVPELFFDTECERVPKKVLKPDMACPICSVPFLDDPYPLVVRLPCNALHMFDLECIRPWLKLKSTCPLDRKDLLAKKKPVVAPVQDDGEEDEFAGMYA